MNLAMAGSQRRASFTGLYAFLVSVTMFFAAFTSAMVVRRGASDDWKGVPAPSLLWVNTGVLAVSSVLAEKARRVLRAGDRRRHFNLWWTGATLLGALFVAGQVMVWRYLHRHGVYLNTTPGSAFFFVGTIAHAVHLGGGWLAMLYLNIRAFRLELGPGRRTAIDVATIYWHFLGILWLYLLWLFRFWGN
ncbi:MAG: cytochrome c oxidase subunit 3 [Bryobacterales bacterium]|nr:cytochrome c oxidase subunit 3 [Bryobacterales bacterium]